MARAVAGRRRGWFRLSGLRFQDRDLVAFLESLTSPAVTTLVERAQAVEISNPTVAGR